MFKRKEKTFTVTFVDDKWQAICVKEVIRVPLKEEFVYLPDLGGYVEIVAVVNNLKDGHDVLLLFKKVVSKHTTTKIFEEKQK